jgi:hypothetical protein
LNISEDEWLRLVKTLGKIKGIQHLTVYCLEGDWYYHPFQAIADAVNSAQSLLILKVLPSYRVLFFNQLWLAGLANALQQHTALQEFTWADFVVGRLRRIMVSMSSIL